MEKIEPTDGTNVQEDRLKKRLNGVRDVRRDDTIVLLCPHSSYAHPSKHVTVSELMHNDSSDMSHE